MLNIVLAALPILGRLLPEGRADEIIAAGSKVAQEFFGTTSEDVVASKLQNDPALAEQFRARLEAETASLRAQAEDIQHARNTMVALAGQGSTIAWAPVVISTLVIIGFLAMALLLMFRQVPDSQLSIVVFSTLSTGFGIVLQYWLGSSAGSARSGDAIRAIAQQATTPTAGQIAGRVLDSAVKVVKK